MYFLTHLFTRGRLTTKKGRLCERFKTYWSPYLPGYVMWRTDVFPAEYICVSCIMVKRAAVISLNYLNS